MKKLVTLLVIAMFFAAINSNAQCVGDRYKLEIFSAFNLSSDISNYQIKGLARETKKIFPKANLKVVKSLIDGRNYRASSELFYKATGFKAVKSVLQANKDFKKMFLKDKKFNPNNKIFNNFEIINDTKKK